MVYSILMLFNFAHGDIFMVGAYIGFGVASALIAVSAMGAFALPGWLILVLTILFSMFLTSFVGMIVERVGYRPLRDGTTGVGGHYRTDDRYHFGDRKPGFAGCPTGEFPALD